LSVLFIMVAYFSASLWIFILFFEFFIVKLICLVLDGNFWYTCDHICDGVLDRTHKVTGIFTVITTKRYLFFF
jgi:hypothetical protein